MKVCKYCNVKLNKDNVFSMKIKNKLIYTKLCKKCRSESMSKNTKGKSPWNKGLSAKDNEIVKDNCEKLHKKVKERYSKGEIIPWNKGKKYKNYNYPKNRKKPALTKEQLENKRQSFTGKNNPRFNPHKSKFEAYKIKCKFEFDLGKYAEEFDLKKVRNMFHPNKNKEGYTRDHIFSIFEGFKQNISPKLIKHPANCQLMLHRENSRKNKWISITKDDLLNNIKKWEKKYGIYK